MSKLNISNKTPQSIVLKQESVINTIQETQNAAVLVFCSAQNPGGGILRGSVAQEEEIAMHSSWYFQVKDLDIFYKKNKDKRDSLNSDDLIFVDKGYLLKNSFGFDCALPVSFIGSTAINLNGLINQHKTIKTDKIIKIMSQRIENILKLAEIKNKKSLILGAFGCGVFGLDSKIISEIFYHKLNQGFFSGNIIFSIPDFDHFSVFSKTFNSFCNDMNIKMLY